MPAPKKTQASATAHANLESLLKKQIALSEEIKEQNEKIRRKLFWMSVGGYIKLAIILAPIVLGIIFIPPMIQEVRVWFESLGVGGVNMGELIQFLSGR